MQELSPRVSFKLLHSQTQDMNNKNYNDVLSLELNWILTIFFLFIHKNSAHLVCNSHNNLGSLMVTDDNTVVIVVNSSKHYKRKQEAVCLFRAGKESKTEQFTSPTTWDPQSKNQDVHCLGRGDKCLTLSHWHCQGIYS